MSDHQLLVRHATEWAGSKSRPLDPQLLEAALNLRELHEHRGAIEWTIHDVDQLLLVRWPAHGPLDPPDPKVLVETLDTYWRFLRATGRMSAKSDDPKALAKAARRAARDLPELAADPAHQSQSKVLQNFGLEMGISLEGAATADELGQRMQAIQDAWNALPVAERLEHMPVTGSVGSKAFPPMSELLSDDPEFDDTPIPGPDAKTVAAEVRASSFVQDCIRLAEWVGARRKVTSTGVLRLAEGRAAYDELDLGDWEQKWWRQGDDEGPLGWHYRSAADCLTVDRLWFAAGTAHLIDIGSTVASRAESMPSTDDNWHAVGLSLLLGLLDGQRFRIPMGPLPMILGLGTLDERPLVLSELTDTWDAHERAERRERVARDEDLDRSPVWRDISDYRFWEVVKMFDDTGIWARDDETLTLTALGQSFALMFFSLLEDGLIEL